MATEPWWQGRRKCTVSTDAVTTGPRATVLAARPAQMSIQLSTCKTPHQSKTRVRREWSAWVPSLPEALVAGPQDLHCGYRRSRYEARVLLFWQPCTYRCQSRPVNMRGRKSGGNTVLSRSDHATALVACLATETEAGAGLK